MSPGVTLGQALLPLGSLGPELKQDKVETCRFSQRETPFALSSFWFRAGKEGESQSELHDGVLIPLP